MQALEVRRVNSSADFLHLGEYVFIEERTPQITIEKSPLGAPLVEDQESELVKTEGRHEMSEAFRERTTTGKIRENEEVKRKIAL